MLLIIAKRGYSQFTVEDAVSSGAVVAPIPTVPNADGDVVGAVQEPLTDGDIIGHCEHFMI